MTDGVNDGRAGLDHHHTRLRRAGDRFLEFAENVIYIGIAAVLVVTALALLVGSFGTLATLLTGPGQDRAIEILDTLLLVFIVVELLYAVRTTVSQRQLLAEPFLLVGIIASIKEIVVLSVKAAEGPTRDTEFTHQVTEIAVLGVLVLLLGLTVWLLRLKEREPEEGGG